MCLSVLKRSQEIGEYLQFKQDFRIAGNQLSTAAFSIILGLNGRWGILRVCLSHLSLASLEPLLNGANAQSIL